MTWKTIDTLPKPQENLQVLAYTESSNWYFMLECGWTIAQQEGGKLQWYLFGHREVRPEYKISHWAPIPKFAKGE